MSNLREIMTRSVVTLKPDSSLMEAKNLMQTYNITRVVLVDDECRPRGILTQKDLVAAVSQNSSERGLEEMRASEAMSTGLIIAKPETHVSKCARQMVEQGISSLIVVDETGKLQGVVTKSDLCRNFGKAFQGMFKVRDAMTHRVVTVKPTYPIFKIIDLMNENSIHRVVVVDKSIGVLNEFYKIVGIVTTADIALAGAILKPLKIREKQPSTLLTATKGIIIKQMAGSTILLTAMDIMTPRPITLNTEQDLGAAAEIMTQHHISGIPVVGGHGGLVGIVTKTDVVKMMSLGCLEHGSYMLSMVPSTQKRW